MNFLEQIRRDEGLRLKPYVDSAGKITIGVGRNLTDNGISEDEAETLLENDARTAIDSLFKALPWTRDIDEARRAVLVNMTFNMGIGRLLKFKMMLAYCESRKWQEASVELRNSNYANQVGDRAKRLAEQLLTGVWQ